MLGFNMTLIDHKLFQDKRSGRWVHLYQDRQGELWLAKSKWDWRRIKLSKGGAAVAIALERARATVHSPTPSSPTKSNGKTV